MEEQQTNRQWQTIEIPAEDFNHRLDQLSSVQASNGALFSRLALIHQVAKACAIEALSGDVLSDLEIEEITNPPLYSYTIDDESVIVRFSYCSQNAD